MAKTAAERMAMMRSRQRAAGLATLSVVVPQADVEAFTVLARRRRARWQDGSRRAVRPLALPPSRAARGGGSAIRPRDILKLRELLEVAAVRLVVDRLSPALERRLRAVLAADQRLDGDATSPDLQRLHALLGELSGDAALSFLLEVALRLTDDHASFAKRRRSERQRVVRRIQRGHAAIVDAILRKDVPRAEVRVRRYLAGLSEWLE